MQNFILGFVVGGGLASLLFFFKNKKEIVRDTSDDSKKEFITEKEEIKSANLEKLKVMIFDSSDKVTNRQVCELLKVSDATAVRYLDELEKEGIVRQIGRTGRSSYYEKA
ncbi:MAG: DeoR family transcriptional regulator [Patescibacteria group bacterium]